MNKVERQLYEALSSLMALWSVIEIGEQPLRTEVNKVLGKCHDAINTADEEGEIEEGAT